MTVKRLFTTRHIICFNCHAIEIITEKLVNLILVIKYYIRFERRILCKSCNSTQNKTVKISILFIYFIIIIIIIIIIIYIYIYFFFFFFFFSSKLFVKSS